MKELIFTSTLLIHVCFLSAQDQNLIDEIKRLEQTEVQAVLQKDTVMLKKLWDKSYIVNNPDNVIVLAKPNVVDRPVLSKPRASFTREVEKILINGDIVISMGNETVVPMGNLPKSGQTVKRRYTNIWMKKEGLWRIVARHANEICQ